MLIMYILRIIIIHCLDGLYCLLTGCLKAVFIVADFLLQQLLGDNK
jgi:hypothetical protein